MTESLNMATATAIVLSEFKDFLAKQVESVLMKSEIN
jgi:hypothetical protein